MTRRAATTATATGGGSGAPIRVLTAVPLCDGHDSAISTVNLEFIRHGIEVVYLGYHRSVRDVVRAAVQEDVAAVGISSYNGGHVEFFSAVVAGLRAAGATDTAVFGGGGGTITARDAAQMTKRGVDRIFVPGESLDEMVAYVKQRFTPLSRERSERVPRNGPRHTPGDHADRALAQALSRAEGGMGKGTPLPVVFASKKTTGKRVRLPMPPTPAQAGKPLVIGVTGPGGAGKTTLIDELVLRFLRAGASVGILSHDPSIVGDGALLGDRATMIYSQDDRVFMRSLASRGRAGGVAPATERCLAVMKGWCGEKRQKDEGGRRKGTRDLPPVGRTFLSTLGEFPGVEPPPPGAGSRPGGTSVFDVIFVETVGIGQEGLPFAAGAVDRTVLVMSPDYGSRLQLQKIVMLDVADVVVVNKSDLSRARTASNEVEARLAANGRGQQLLSTVAKRHGDSGVDQLFAALTSAKVAR